MIDFKTLTSTTDRYNFHSHTQFCDGHATMAEFAEAAVASRFDHWGFSPHSPIPIASPCNMPFEKVDEYLAEAKRLRELHASDIALYAAMEIDYLGRRWGPSEAYFDELPLDYRIGSIHFIPNRQGVLVDIDGSFDNFRLKMAKFFDNDIRYVVNRFYDNSLQMLASGGFDIIGHFDKIGHNATHFSPGIEDETWYDDRVNELIGEIIASGVTVEINTKARRDHGRFFPAMRHWQRLLKAGVTIVVNSDAHHTELIDASRREVVDELKRMSTIAVQ